MKKFFSFFKIKIMSADGNISRSALGKLAKASILEGEYARKPLQSVEVKPRGRGLVGGRARKMMQEAEMDGEDFVPVRFTNKRSAVYGPGIRANSGIAVSAAGKVGGKLRKIGQGLVGGARVGGNLGFGVKGKVAAKKSPWIKFVKAYAEQLGVSYADALLHYGPEISEAYHGMYPDVVRKPKRERKPKAPKPKKAELIEALYQLGYEKKVLKKVAKKELEIALKEELKALKKGKKGRGLAGDEEPLGEMGLGLVGGKKKKMRKVY